jgi:predicted small secreted protein
MTQTNTFARILLMAAVPFALAACSEKTQEETGEAAAAAGNDIENTGERMENSMERAGDNIEAGAAETRQETGEALEEAGEDLQNPK